MTSTYSLPDHNNQNIICNIVNLITGSILTLLGGWLCLAYYLAIPSGLKWLTTFPESRLEARFMILLWGLALIGLGRGWYLWARFTAGLLVMLGGVVGIGIATGQNVFCILYPSSDASVESLGLSVSSMVFFCIILACGIWLLARPNITERNLLISHFLGLLFVFGGALIFFVQASARTPPLPASPACILAALLGGFAFVTSSFLSARTDKVRRLFWPELISAGGIYCTLCLWYVLDQELIQRIQRQVQSEAAQAQHNWHQYTQDRHNQIRQLAQRWPHLSPEQRQQAVSLYVGQTPSCLGIWQIDEEGSLVPLELRRQAGVAETALVPWVQPPATWAERQERLLVNPHGVGRSRDTLLLLMQPLAEEGKASHLLILYSSLGHLFQGWGRYLLERGFAVVVESEERVIFQWQGGEKAIRPQWQESLPLRWANTQWQMTVWPTQEFLAQEEMFLPHGTLAVGLIVTLCCWRW